MLIIYFKSDGEIHQVATGYKTLEEYYGRRLEEFSLIFDSIYIEEQNDYIFNRFFDFKVINNQLKFKNTEMLPIFN